jgi:hypothetical protein
MGAVEPVGTRTDEEHAPSGTTAPPHTGGQRADSPETDLANPDPPNADPATVDPDEAAPASAEHADSSVNQEQQQVDLAEAGPASAEHAGSSVSQEQQQVDPGEAGSAKAEPAVMFTDVKSGFWAGTTTVFCVAVAGAGNLVLLAAALGQSARSGHWDFGGVVMWGLAVGVPVGIIVGLLRLILPVRNWQETRGRWAISIGAAVVAALATGLSVGLLYAIAWLSATGTLPFSWQPVVGFTMSVVAMGSFGGYYLASRRSRVGFAASFVLTFLVLLSFMLTLDGLARAVGGSDSNEAALGAAKAIQDLLTDFRGSVALIVGFYFGTDAAVSVVKMFRTTSGDPAEISRMDRDLAVPRPQSPVEPSSAPHVRVDGRAR